jgi:hypothetical protein
MQQTFCSLFEKGLLTDGGTSRPIRLRHPTEYSILHIDALQALLSARAAAACVEDVQADSKETNTSSRKRPLDAK